MLLTMQEVRLRSQQMGSKWFDESNMRFFRTTLGQYAYLTPDEKHAFFVSGERMFEIDKRKFSVRRFVIETGRVYTVGIVGNYDNRRTADLVAKAFATKNWENK